MKIAAVGESLAKVENCVAAPPCQFAWFFPGARVPSCVVSPFSQLPLTVPLLSLLASCFVSVGRRPSGSKPWP